jgi:large subunit ribosomal protein L21
MPAVKVLFGSLEQSKTKIHIVFVYFREKASFALPKSKIMYAIVEIAGQQFKAEAGKKLYVHKLEGNEGDKVTFDKVLLTDNDGKITVGVPTVSGVKVNATILRHAKGDKVIIFKKKRRKGYKKLNGHRQSFTQINIESIA